jgi:hypothetical protein
LRGQIPFPPASREWLDRLLADYESSENLPILHAYYRDFDSRISVLLRSATVVGGKIVDTEAHEAFGLQKAQLDWQPDGRIAQRSRLPGFRAAKVVGRLKRSA